MSLLSEVRLVIGIQTAKAGLGPRITARVMQLLAVMDTELDASFFEWSEDALSALNDLKKAITQEAAVIYGMNPSSFDDEEDEIADEVTDSDDDDLDDRTSNFLENMYPEDDDEDSPAGTN
jgi:hypothetical protein